MNEHREKKTAQLDNLAGKYGKTAVPRTRKDGSHYANCACPVCSEKKAERKRKARERYEQKKANQEFEQPSNGAENKQPAVSAEQAVEGLLKTISRIMEKAGLDPLDKDDIKFGVEAHVPVWNYLFPAASEKSIWIVPAAFWFGVAWRRDQQIIKAVQKVKASKVKKSNGKTETGQQSEPKSHPVDTGKKG